jgi:hypothetical protein
MRQIADENFRAWKRLERLLSDLAARDLSLVIMPGAALMALYPDPGCRAMDDIDVLIQPGQAAHVKECLAQSGFASVERHDELYFDNDLVVDLHEDLMNATRVKARRYIGWMEPADVWRSRHSRVIEGGQVETMDSEDMLIFTAVHALKHSFKRLTWLIDLYLLTQKVNWQIVARRAEQYGFKRLLDYSLVLLQTRLGAVLPPEGQQRCAELVLSTSEQRLLNRVFEQRRHAVWGDLLLALSVRGTGKRAIFLAETYFPRPQVLLQVFPYMPKVLFPLAYGLRLTQVLLVGLRHLTRLVRRW